MTRQIRTIGIVGTGTMGRGIAQIGVLAGMTVHLHDARNGAAAEAAQFVTSMLERLVEKRRLGAGAAEEAHARLVVEPDLEGLASCDLVVEAIVEDLAAKQALFAKLERQVREDAILASNTSSLSITAIAAGCAHPERVAGYHFFNPVPLMKVVEVVGGARTEAGVLDALCALATAMGHRPVRAADTPGFLVNHAGRGFGTEALAIAAERVADFATIDLVLREGAGFRMGPFELMDVTALDVSHPVMEEIYRQFYDEPRFRPSVITRQRLAAGLLGRKAGEGFYRYGDNGQEDRLPVFPQGDRGLVRSVFVGAAEDEVARAALADDLAGAGLAMAEDGTTADLCVVMPFGHDCTTAALAQGLDPEKTVAVDPVAGFDGVAILARVAAVMTNPATRADLALALREILARPDRPAVVIADSPGFVAQRVIATIANIACEIAQRGIASPADIDVAVRLGLGYPKGPLALADTVGAARIVTILDRLLETTGDPRYRTSPWLRRRAALGMGLAAG
jgi:3-hydroxybutyryl-CoA dehydrogenase